MPKVRRRLADGLLEHLRVRMIERGITAVQLGLLSDRLATDPEVPAGRWFKSFPGLIVCGEGELVKTFLRLGQVPEGEEVV